MAGRLPRPALLDALGGFGCCIVPSLWEEFGYAALEALGAGVPRACAPGLGFAGLSGGGVFVAAQRTAQSLADQVLLALAADTFEFPAECKATNALRRLTTLYETVAASRPST